MLDIDEMRERQEREWQGRVLAVIAEFGGQRRQPLLVPEDDPANDELVLRLAGEVLFLRDQLQRTATAVEWARAGKPFALIPPGPHADHSQRETTESRRR
jgi:hypothetical protein